MDCSLLFGSIILLPDKNQAAALPAFKAFVRAAQWFSKSESGCHESICGNQPGFINPALECQPVSKLANVSCQMPTPVFNECLALTTKFSFSVRHIAGAVAFLTRLAGMIFGERPNGKSSGIDLDSAGCGWPLR
jgi:hypothetical protein